MVGVDLRQRGPMLAWDSESPFPLAAGQMAPYHLKAASPLPFQANTPESQVPLASGANENGYISRNLLTIRGSTGIRALLFVLFGFLSLALTV